MSRREELEHPLGLIPPPAVPSPQRPAPPASAEPRTFVLEVGGEELPPDDVVSAVHQLRCGGGRAGACLQGLLHVA